VTQEIKSNTEELIAGQNEILARIEALQEAAMRSANPMGLRSADLGPDAIFAQIDNLAAELPPSLKARVQESNDRLQMYFESLTTDFDPTVINQSDIWSETKGTVRGVDDEDKALPDAFSRPRIDHSGGPLHDAPLADDPMGIYSADVPRYRISTPQAQNSRIVNRTWISDVDHELLGLDFLEEKQARERILKEMECEHRVGPKNGTTYRPMVDYHILGTTEGYTQRVVLEPVLRLGATQGTFYAWIRAWIMSGNATDVLFKEPDSKPFDPEMLLRRDADHSNCHSPLDAALELRDEVLLNRVLESRTDVFYRGLHAAVEWNVRTARKLVHVDGSYDTVSVKHLSEWEARATQNPALYHLSLQQIQDHVCYILRFLLESKRSLEFNRNQLCTASRFGATAVVIFLLEMGMDPNGDGMLAYFPLPLYSAIRGRQGHIIKLLVDAGVDCLRSRERLVPTLKGGASFEVEVNAVEYAAYLHECGQHNRGQLNAHTDYLEILNQALGTKYKAKISKILSLKLRSYGKPLGVAVGVYYDW
jgi:hypothetical protein